MQTVNIFFRHPIIRIYLMRNDFSRIKMTFHIFIIIIYMAWFCVHNAYALFSIGYLNIRKNSIRNIKIVWCFCSWILYIFWFSLLTFQKVYQWCIMYISSLLVHDTFKLKYNHKAVYLTLNLFESIYSEYNKSLHKQIWRCLSIPTIYVITSETTLEAKP